MADKKITDLILRSNVNDDVNFPIDDGIQTYRVTGPQVATYSLAKSRNIVFKTANYTAAAGDHIISCDATGGSFAIALPTAVGISGKMYLIKRIDSTYANAVTIDPNSTETINGQLTLRLMVNQGCTIVSNGTNWIVLDQTAVPAGLIGSINWAITSSVLWSRQNSSFGAMTNSAGTPPSPTVKNHATSPGSTLLAISFPALPAGNYRIAMYGCLHFTGGNGTTHGFRFNDGSTTSNANIGIAPVGDQNFGSIEGLFSYSTDQGATTFSVEARCDGTDTIYVDLDRGGLQIDVYYFPNI